MSDLLEAPRVAEGQKNTLQELSGDQRRQLLLALVGSEEASTECEQGAVQNVEEALDLIRDKESTNVLAVIVFLKKNTKATDEFLERAPKEALETLCHFLLRILI